MIRFFRGSGIGPVIVLTLITLGLWVQYFIAPPQITGLVAGEPMPLWRIITEALSATPLLAVTVSFLLALVVAVTMVRFNTSIFFIPRRTIFPALMYILLFSVFPGEMVLNPALPAAILIMAGFWRIITAYRAGGMAINFFDAALLISAGGMFYAGSVWFLILVFIGALILRSPDLKELTIAFAGAILPWLVLYAVWYLTGRSINGLTEIIRHNLFDETLNIYLSRTMVILLAVTGLIFIPALFSVIREMTTMKIRSRKTFELLFWMIIVSVACYIFVPAISAEMNSITAIPVAFIMSGYFTFTRRTVTVEILFWLMMIMLIISRIWPY
jgi:hypothetical protein